MTTNKKAANPEIIQTSRYLLTFLAKDRSALGEIEKIVKEHGQIEKKEDLGVKKLFFPINKEWELSLLSIFFQADSSVIKKLERQLKEQNSIFRFILTRWNAEIEKNIQPKRKQTVTAKTKEMVHV